MLKLFIVVSVFLGLSQSTYPLPPHPLGFVWQEVPIRYNQNLYGLKTPTSFVHALGNGQILWTISTESPIRQYDIQFNRILLLTQSGQLSVYDAHFGFLQWRFNRQAVQQFESIFPNIVILTQSGEVMAFELSSGIKQWSKRGPYRELSRHTAAELLILKDQNLSLESVHVTNGQVSNTDPIELSKNNISDSPWFLSNFFNPKIISLHNKLGDRMRFSGMDQWTFEVVPSKTITFREAVSSYAVTIELEQLNPSDWAIVMPVASEIYLVQKNQMYRLFIPRPPRIQTFSEEEE